MGGQSPPSMDDKTEGDKAAENVTRPTITSMNTAARIDELSCTRKIFLLMEEPSLHPTAERIHHVYSLLILGSVVTMVVGTLQVYATDPSLAALEVTFNLLFTFEAAVRVFCAPQKLVLLKSMYMWMDICAVVPFFVFSIVDIEPSDNAFLELLVLLVPILRLLKVTRHSSGWRILIISLQQCVSPLSVPAFLLLLMTVFSSCLLFWIEKYADSEDGAAFESIPHAMWFTICTVSTVGYGDVSPNSDIGKAAASGLILVGVCYMAMPLAIVGGTFSDIWAQRDKILIAEKAKAKFAGGGFAKDDLHRLFRMVDVDDSGELNRSEFVGLLDAFNLGFTQAQIKKLFRTIDEDNTGNVNFEEFADFLFPDVELDNDNDSNNPASPAEGAAPMDSGDPKSPKSPGRSCHALDSILPLDSSGSCQALDSILPLDASGISPSSSTLEQKKSVPILEGNADLKQRLDRVEIGMAQMRRDMKLQFEKIRAHAVPRLTPLHAQR